MECRPGVPQIPWSDYAAPCVAKFAGDNGGETARGVTAEKIRIARRDFDQTSQWSPIVQAAGVASEEVCREVRDTFVAYFNKVFELYGRTVEFVDFTASTQSSDVEEAQSRGKEGACIDATKVAQEIKALAAARERMGTVRRVPRGAEGRPLRRRGRTSRRSGTASTTRTSTT